MPSTVSSGWRWHPGLWEGDSAPLVSLQVPAWILRENRLFGRCGPPSAILTVYPESRIQHRYPREPYECDSFYSLS